MGLSEAERQRALEATAAAVRSCTRCGLHTGRTHAVPGEGSGNAAILLVGEAPGRDEDASGRPFVGRAGRILDAALEAAGVPRESVFITNLVKCRPPGNRRPTREEWGACRPYLLGQIALVSPQVIVTLGATALHGLLGPGIELQDARGTARRLGELTVLATYHPAGVLYNRKLDVLLRRDLRNAARMAARPAPHARRRAPTGRRSSPARGATR